MKYTALLMGFVLCVCACKKDAKPAKLSVTVVTLKQQSVANAEVHFYVNSERIINAEKKTIDTVLTANASGEVVFSVQRECYLDVEAYEPVSSGARAWGDTLVHLEPNTEAKITIVLNK